MPVQWHALALGLFASIIAPFGGFFASGFKRAFKFKVLILFGIICWKYISPSKISLCLYIQDFGDSIPGHGGFTDRMDCQVCTFNLFCFQKVTHLLVVILNGLNRSLNVTSSLLLVYSL